MKQVKFLAILAIALIAIRCQKDEVNIPSSTELSSSVPQAWVATALDLVKNTPGFSPPVAARTFGYLGVAMYEAARYGDPNSVTLAGQLEGLALADMPSTPNEALSWDIATNAAAYEILKACLVGAKVDNEQILKTQNDKQLSILSVNIDVSQVEKSVAFGTAVGQSIVKFAISDSQVECYKTNFDPNYILRVGEAAWVPTGAQKTPLQPYWGNVRTFGKNSKNAFIVAPHTYSTNPSSTFYQEANEVNAVFTTLNERQRVIASYWSDDPGLTATPPGHSMSIASQVLAQQSANLSEYTEVMAKIGMVLHDAFVTCWKSKYEFNLLRPSTYITKVLNPNFKSFLPTPPFPEYPSGHSVQSGAAAAILENQFGLKYKFVDKTHQFRTDINGTPRTFLSFADFANEAAASRLYGGIHYNQAIVEGVKQGREVAKEVLKLQFKK